MGKLLFIFNFLNLDRLFYICVLENRCPYFSQRQESGTDLNGRKKEINVLKMKKKKIIEHAN